MSQDTHSGENSAQKFDNVAMRNVEFRNADLTGAKFTDVSLQAAAFEDINLQGATLHNVKLFAGHNLRRQYRRVGY